MLPKRTTWFGLGLLTGVAGAVWGYVRARELAAVDPDAVARRVVDSARAVTGGAREFAAQSRTAMAEVEAELRTRR